MSLCSILPGQKRLRSALWHSQHGGERCHGKTKWCGRNGASRQHSDDWESWTRFEQGEDKGLTASSLPYFDIWRVFLLWRYIVTEPLKLIARKLQSRWNVFPHTLVSLLSEGTFDWRWATQMPSKSLWVLRDVDTEIALGMLTWLQNSALEPQNGILLWILGFFLTKIIS